jgi:hypothetical protein
MALRSFLTGIPPMIPDLAMSFQLGFDLSNQPGIAIIHG